MVCEKCGQATDTVVCARCGETILRLGSFCYKCGCTITDTKHDPEPEEPDALDFSNRVLCSDGTCIGVINEEGICKVCGKPYSPDA